MVNKYMMHRRGAEDAEDVIDSRKRLRALCASAVNISFFTIITGFFLMTATATLLAEDLTCTGASAAFTSNDLTVKQALALLDQGKYSDAEKLVANAAPSSDVNVTEARAELPDVIQRMRREYSLTEADLLTRIQRRIPNATTDDITKWRDAHQLLSRVIDGQRFYFNREPQNLFIVSADAKQRDIRKTDNTGWKLTDHLQKIVDEAESTGKTEVCPVQHQIDYSITVGTDAPGFKKGALVRMWLPYPQEYRQQQNVKLLSSSPGKPFIAPSAIDGPTVANAQRTAYFEQRIDDPTKPIEAKISFSYTSFAYYPKLDEKLVQPLPADWGNAYLVERLPHIKFTPQITAKVHEIIGDETNPLAKARKIFHWVSANIPWHAEQEYCTIRSLSDWGFTNRTGDCGVQGSVFITMCRIAGVPARWQTGWETKPVGNSMHDWSEIYIAPWGWLPADASYGVQKSDDPRIADFYLGHQDAYRMIVNLDYGRPLNPPKKSFRSEPADFQRGEVEIVGKNLYFDDWDYNITIRVDGKEI
jgi:hypothetical protein